MGANFMGSSSHNLDQKNRLSVPIRFRKGLGEEFILCKPITDEKCLFLYPFEEWERVVESVCGKFSGKKKRELMRAMYRNIENVTVDAQWRFTIKPDFCEKLGIGKNVTLLGVNDKIELWDTAEYDGYDDMTESYDEVDVNEIDY